MKSRSFNLFVILALFLSLLGSAVTVTPAYAAGITVNSNADTVAVDGSCTLREAITNANNDAATNVDCFGGSGADTITFTADYTITLAGSQLPAITSTMTITGNGPTKTILQASTCNPVTLPGGCPPATYRIFEVKSTGNLTLDSLTARHGNCISACDTFVNYGGGIYNEGTLNLKSSTLSGNNSSFTGGGIRSSGTLTVTDSTLSGNKAGAGGGIDNRGPMTVSNTTFSGNQATDNFGGGGIINIGISPFIVTTITNSTFFNNSANIGLGGGISHNNGTLTLKNNTFSNNSALLGGGGLFSMTTLHLINTIIANSTSGGDCYITIPLISNINNIIEDGTCNVGTTLQNFKTGDPNLGPLADNGGPTQTMALQPGSSAIDAGDAATCAAAPVSNKDQRGTTRPQGASCDIGAYEVSGGIPVVTASNPSANAVLTSLSSITVVFNQDMLNNGSAQAANNTANYILVERGANGVFNTTSCAGGVVSDDVQKTISTATYNNAGFIATLTLASPLTNGTYRLFVCGTTSVWSTAGIELNNGVNDHTVDFTIGTGTGTAENSTSSATTASSLPKTGFAPNKITTLPEQPADSAYTALGGLWLEIPSLKVKSNIVGVPQAENAWDVKWLGNDAGWLNGTAFPSWEGNSVITGHVTDSNGLPGPFANIKGLQHGDQIIVHMGGMKYIFEVRNSKLVRPDTTDFAFEHLEGNSYITLITCSGYNPLNGSYLFRRIVRAVLVSVVNE